MGNGGQALDGRSPGASDPGAHLEGPPRKEMDSRRYSLKGSFCSLEEIWPYLETFLAATAAVASGAPGTWWVQAGAAASILQCTLW